MKKSIVLVGIAGAGKTTTGKALSEKLNIELVDVDDEIEKRSNQSILKFFDNKGEEAFRDLEFEIINQALKNGNNVIATGGNAFLQDRTRDAIKKYGISVNLFADVKTLVNRIAKKKSSPLLGKSAKELTTIIEEYNKIYNEADTHINTTNYSTAEVVDDIAELTNLKDHHDSSKPKIARF